ncbi:MAG: GIY-YIG nuclease family protein [Leptolyngbyaceae bacterium]|nr:GIY-YIG nuclease family protein [Leptolyngbyaceae bacterium]
MSDLPSLASLDYVPYIDESGVLPIRFQGKVGVYAIFDAEQTLQFISYSRDVYLSLQQHLVRQPQGCYWLKVHQIEKPNRTILETIRDAWIAENGTVPLGNGPDEAKWNQPIDVKAVMTAEEQSNYADALDEMTQAKLLKKAARRVEEEVLQTLKARGVQMQFRFDPKLKESGVLNLK